MSQRTGKPLAKKPRSLPDISTCQNKQSENKPRSGPVNKKVRSAWTEAATDTFFEGLYRHGKEFEKIYNFMTTKYRKMTDPLIASLTHSQVRFYYYQMWKKVSDYLLCAQNSASCEEQPPVVTDEHKDDRSSCLATDSATDTEMELEFDNLISTRPADSTVSDDDMMMEVGGEKGETTNSLKKKESLKESVAINGKKYPLDLVALICYGKNRQYLRGIKSKVELGNILSNLVHNGAVQIDHRGRNRKKTKLNLKIPIVRAFKGKEISENPPMPGHAEPCSSILELLPANTGSWCYVQGIAQNPRLRVTVPARYKLEGVKTLLVTKWKIPSCMNVAFYSKPSGSSGWSQDPPEERGGSAQDPPEERGGSAHTAGEELALDCSVSSLAGGESKPVSIVYKLSQNDSKDSGEDSQSCMINCKSLAVLLKIGQSMKTVLEPPMPELEGLTTPTTENQTSPMGSPLNSLSLITRSPFKKYSRLKNSCYSSPTRRRIELSPAKRSRRVSEAPVEGTTPKGNLVTFQRSDMEGESFSTLRMHNILDSVQQQMSDTPTAAVVGKSAAHHCRQSPSTPLTGTPTHHYHPLNIEAESVPVQPASSNVMKALQDVKGISKRRRGKLAQGSKATQNLLPRPYQSGTLTGLGQVNAGDNNLASTLLLQNVIEQLKVKLLIQALQKQQKNAVVGPSPMALLPAQFSLPKEPEKPVSAAPLQLPLTPASQSFTSLEMAHLQPSTDVSLASAVVAPFSSLPEAPPSASLAMTQNHYQDLLKPPAPSSAMVSDLHDPFILNSDSAFQISSALGGQKSVPSVIVTDHQETSSNASFTDLLRGLSDSVDNSLMGMLHHLKTVSPAKDQKKEGIPEPADLSFDSIMALLESPNKKAPADPPASSSDVVDRSHVLKLPPVEFHDEDTSEFIRSFRTLSGM